MDYKKERLELEMDFYNYVIESKGKALSHIAMVGLGSTAGTLLGSGVTAFLKRKSNFCKEISDSPEEYAKCMAKFKIKALMRKREMLENKKSLCSTSRNPERCITSIEIKIDMIDRAINNLRSKRGI